MVAQRLEYHSSSALKQESGWSCLHVTDQERPYRRGTDRWINVPEVTQPVERMEPESVQAPDFWPLLSAPLIKVT